MSFRKFIASTALLFLSLTLHAEVSTSPWYLDTGMRYWLGLNQFSFDLQDVPGESLLSRLTYEDVTTSTAEAFWQLTHKSGAFFKGYVGAGSNLNGEFIDEDFPPIIADYSRTVSAQKHGHLNYFTVDFGYNLSPKESYTLSPFIGYHYWSTRYNNFGCTQTADDTTICARPLPSTMNTLSDEPSWRSLRLGLNALVKFSENIEFIADAAYLFSYLSGNDYHHLRPDIRGMFFEGTGDGVQLDMTLNWLATPKLSFGLGARWWEITTDGYSHFEETALEGQAQPVSVTQSNYGLLFQTNYRFDDVNAHSKTLDKDMPAGNPHQWGGFFVGGNLGYGMHPSTTFITPFYNAFTEALASPYTLHLEPQGFLTGGQVGYNWTNGETLFGLELDLDYSNISGVNSVSFTSAPYLNTTAIEKIDWFGTARFKLGRHISERLLPYVTAGLSLTDASIRYNQSSTFPELNPLFSSSESLMQTMAGVTAGAGLEYAVSNHLRYKLEYLYLNAGQLKFTDDGGGVNIASNILRLGVNYHF